MNTIAQLKKGNCSRHENFKHAMSSISQYIVIEQTDGSLPQVPYSSVIKRVFPTERSN